MRPVVVVLLHEESDTPAYMAVYLAQRGIDFVVFQFWKDDMVHMVPVSVDTPVRCIKVDNAPHRFMPVPATCTEGEVCRVRGVASFGGSMSVNDDRPHYEPILHLMRSCIHTRTPVIGHCLGAQLLSCSLGGTVQSSENIEVGWMDLEVENNGTDGVKDWFGGRKTINVFQIHTESFSIPQGARRIVRGKYCTNQAYQVGDQYALGMQFHPEVDEEKVKGLVAPTFPSLHTCEEIAAMSKEKAARLSPAAMTRDAIANCLREGRIEQNRPLADSIYDVWCSGFLF
ncbi:glutamine amidotransferase class-I [Trypanosoma grayi]|uniref:glutamine amidotransferase class-I n=1 Tax=Trypanosoma grayi TaxID=71804 RepID=UPI0004F46E31|nr:glutamine amidotransferase class-I [Trypanosoma grayi]KEG10328.1 glutamine amidotransferase class-I [Trypanosoma grayi]